MYLLLIKIYCLSHLFVFIQSNCIQNKISSNNGILLNEILRTNLLNFPFASSLFKNLGFSLSHIPHFHDRIVLPILILKTLGFMCFVFFYTLNNKMILFCIWDFKLLLIISFSVIISSIPIFLPSWIRLIFPVSFL